MVLGIILVSLDFTKGNVLLIDMGERPTGGYSFIINEIVNRDNYTSVIITYTILGNNCISTEALTNPYKFVWIESKKEILVSEKLEVKNCN